MVGERGSVEEIPHPAARHLDDERVPAGERAGFSGRYVVVDHGFGLKRLPRGAAQRRLGVTPPAVGKVFEVDLAVVEDPSAPSAD